VPEKNRKKHPFDAPLSGALQFGTKLIAWLLKGAPDEFD
jgi:hypothetical protein